MSRQSVQRPGASRANSPPRDPPGLPCLVLQDRDVAEPGATQNRIVDDSFHVRLDHVDAIEMVERDVWSVLVQDDLGFLVLGNTSLLVAHADGCPHDLVELIVLPMGMV